MSAATSSAGLIAGAMGSGKASLLRSRLPAGEWQILHRVDRGGILIGERELRHQLDRKDDHPLAREDELLDVLAELEARGLLEAELCFRLTAQGRERLAAEPLEPGRAFAVMEDDSVLCVECAHEAARDGQGAQSLVHAWIDAGPGVLCVWCTDSGHPGDGGEG